MLDNKENVVIDSEWLRSALPYITTLVLSCWGGLVSHVQKLRQKTRKFNMRDLAFDLIISSFAGILTHLLCVYSKIDGAMAAMLIAVSGHMGTKAITSMEKLRDRVFGVSDDDKQPKD